MLSVTVGNSANRDQTMPISPPQSGGVQWSPVDSSGLQWTHRPVDSSGFPTGLDSSGLLVHLVWLDQYLI